MLQAVAFLAGAFFQSKCHQTDIFYVLGILQEQLWTGTGNGNGNGNGLRLAWRLDPYTGTGCLSQAQPKEIENHTCCCHPQGINVGTQLILACAWMLAEQFVGNLEHPAV